MDTALPLKSVTAQASSARAHFERYLNREHGARRHRTVVFHDGRAPSYLLDAISAIAWTELSLVDVRSVPDQARYLEAECAAEDAYLSIHEVVLDTAISRERGAVSFAKRSPRCDFTSYEFPRFACSDAQRDLILTRHFSGDPHTQRKIADRFYALLEARVPYEVTVRSGPAFASVLTVSDAHPWLELCGPLLVGDVRFTPGCELFYSGAKVNGEIYFGSGLNITPLKCDGDYSPRDLEAYERLNELSSALAASPVRVRVRDGVISDVEESGRAVRELLGLDRAYGRVNEVGIGLNPAAIPLVTDWASNSNEAAPGVHLGFGADPGNRERHETAIHYDFVEPNVCIDINGTRFYSPADGFGGII